MTEREDKKEKEKEKGLPLFPKHGQTLSCSSRSTAWVGSSLKRVFVLGVLWVLGFGLLFWVVVFFFFAFFVVSAHKAHTHRVSAVKIVDVGRERDCILCPFFGSERADCCMFWFVFFLCSILNR